MDLEPEEIIQSIANLNKHIDWCNDQTELAGAALLVIAVATIIVAVLFGVTGFVKYTGAKSTKGEYAAGMIFGLASITLIILAVAIFLALAAIYWQFPGEISAAERAIAELESMLP